MQRIIKTGIPARQRPIFAIFVIVIIIGYVVEHLLPERFRINTVFEHLAEKAAIYISKRYPAWSVKSEIPIRFSVAIYPRPKCTASNLEIVKNYAYFFKIYGSYAESAHYFKESLRIGQCLYGAADHSNLILMSSQNELQVNNRRFAEAEETALSAFTLAKSTPGDAWLIGTGSRLAQIYADQGKFKQACDVSQQVLDFCDKNYKKDDCNTVCAKYELAGMLVKAEDYQRAKLLLDEVRPRLNQFESYPGYPSEMGVASLYRAMREFEKADEIENQASSQSPNLK